MQTLSVGELQAQLSAQAHHVKLLAQALGECIQAAGITRAGAALTGPELLMFADDLKRHLETQAAGNGMPEGAERCEVCDTITARMDGDGCAKWCCCCGARLTGNYVSMSEPATLENDAAASPSASTPPVKANSELIEALTELVSASRSVNSGKHFEVKGLQDNEPCYWQRKEWVDWLIASGEIGARALAANIEQER